MHLFCLVFTHTTLEAHLILAGVHLSLNQNLLNPTLTLPVIIMRLQRLLSHMWELPTLACLTRTWYPVTGCECECVIWQITSRLQTDDSGGNASSNNSWRNINDSLRYETNTSMTALQLHVITWTWATHIHTGGIQKMRRKRRRSLDWEKCHTHISSQRWMNILIIPPSTHHAAQAIICFPLHHWFNQVNQT